MFLHITEAGGRYWRLKYRHGGKEKLLALGVHPAVGLKDARERREAARQALGRGDDPGELRKAAKAKAVHEATNTLQAVAEDWLMHQAGWWEPVTLARTRASLEADVFPTLGSLPIVSVTTLQVMALVKKIEKRGAAEIAGRVLQRIKAIYRYAVTYQRIEHNQMLDLVPSEILKRRRVQHRAALAVADLPEFLAKLDTYGGDPPTSKALRLPMLTAVRPGEVRGARWAEFDLKARLWRIPDARMKMRVEHLVPLSDQALAVLEAMKPLSGERELVFPSPTMPAGTPPEKVLAAARIFARENFALQYRYAMALHADQAHPHVHLVVKCEHEYEPGRRLYIRKDTLRQWCEQFAVQMREQGWRPMRCRGRSAARCTDRSATPSTIGCGRCARSGNWMPWRAASAPRQSRQPSCATRCWRWSARLAEQWQAWQRTPTPERSRARSPDERSR